MTDTRNRRPGLVMCVCTGKCPGFETDIHGLVEQVDENGERRFYADCVAEGEPKQAPALTMDDMIQTQHHSPFSSNF